MKVAAAIIRDNQNNILICQRSSDSKNANLWEFPGGKLESGETLKECAVRECKEELNIDVDIFDVFAETTYKYPDGEFAFTFFNAEILCGNMTTNVHQNLKWIEAKDLIRYNFCPDDIAIVEKLRRNI